MQTLADQQYEGWVVVEAEQNPTQANPYKYACIGKQPLYKAANKAGYSIANR